ncbi:MAG: hypothetical protein HN348_19030, partial [Proteobacteria bacterium]|nr:hypothetical protein [Pseudomonadota bacterium]
MTLLVLLSLQCLAMRPTQGGLWSFDSTDDVVHHDEATGLVRVHYSIDGPNRVRQGDGNANDLPDFVEDVGDTSVEVLDFYSQSLGLRLPISEAEMGLGNLGGSEAFDFYLIDFAGNADGLFGIDACTTIPRHCSGYMVMENDFSGYGYPTTDMAISVLTSHELFHAVQAAYDSEQESWFSEGTAVWGEKQFDPDSLDFLWFAAAYLEDTGRTLNRPPTGPIPTFSYSTALWWDFLRLRHDAEFMVDLLEATETLDGKAVDTLAEMEILL